MSVLYLLALSISVRCKPCSFGTVPLYMILQITNYELKVDAQYYIENYNLVFLLFKKTSKGNSVF